MLRNRELLTYMPKETESALTVKERQLLEAVETRRGRGVQRRMKGLAKAGGGLTLLVAGAWLLEDMGMQESPSGLTDIPTLGGDFLQFISGIAGIWGGGVLMKKGGRELITGKKHTQKWIEKEE